MAPEYGTRSPQQVVWLVGAVSLVVVMVLGGGWLALRGMPEVSRDPDRPAPTESAAAPSADSDAALAGLPWPHPLTRDGAVAAALAVITATGLGDVVFDAERFREIAAVVFTPGEAAAQAEQVDAARAELEASAWGQQPASRRMYHFAPLAARLVDFADTPRRARVEVWAMTLVGVGDAGGAAFTTSTVELVAADDNGTWRVADVETEDGPTPLVQAAASAPGRTRALLRDAVATMPVPVDPP